MIGLVVSLLLAAPVQAAPPDPVPAFAAGDCMAGQLPADMKDRMEGAATIEDLLKSGDPRFDARSAALACGVTREGQGPQPLLSYYVGMTWLERRLTDRWPRETLRNAWLRLPEREREIAFGTVMKPKVINWTTEQKAVIAKLFAPFGRTDWSYEAFDELDLYLGCQAFVLWAYQDRAERRRLEDLSGAQ